MTLNLATRDATEREFALTDPVGFLAALPEGAILDEVQRVPSLLSHLLRIVDDDPTPGRFILTGSQKFALLENVSQSLAERTALLQLLPLNLEEVRRFPTFPQDLDRVLWHGGVSADLRSRAEPE